MVAGAAQNTTLRPHLLLYCLNLAVAMCLPGYFWNSMQLTSVLVDSAQVTFMAQAGADDLARHLLQLQSAPFCHHEQSPLHSKCSCQWHLLHWLYMNWQ